MPSDTFLKAIKPGDPRKRISDGDGLVLLLFLKPGEHGWRFNYRFAGRRNMSVRAVGWRGSDVDHWTAERPQVSH